MVNIELLKFKDTNVIQSKWENTGRSALAFLSGRKQIRALVGDEGWLHVQVVKQNVFQRFITFLTRNEDCGSVVFHLEEKIKPPSDLGDRSFKDFEVTFLKDTFSKQDESISEIQRKIFTHIKTHQYSDDEDPML